MIAKLDDQLKPVARRSFDFNDPERMAILWLQDISAKARSAGIQIKPILEEVAGLSSEINKYGMGSTKGLLLNAR
jgi:hypothetical protein